MKKVLLSVAMAIAAIANTQAQQMTDGNWWGYIPYPCERIDLGNGEEPDSYQAAILVPGYELDVRGKAIDGIRFYLRGTDYMTDLGVWVSTQLPGIPSVADTEFVPLDPTQMNGGDDPEWGPGLVNEVYFSKPYVIPKKGLYVGYGFTITQVESESDWTNAYPLMTAWGAAPNDNASFVSMTQTMEGWWRMTQIFENPNVCIQAHIVDAPEEGDDTGIRTMDNGQLTMDNCGSVYDLQGRLLQNDNEYRGVQIVRMADGTIRKVITE